MLGLNLYPSRQITQTRPVSSPRSSIWSKIVPLAVTWPLSLVLIPKAPSCLSRIAMAKRFFSLRVFCLASSINLATFLFVQSASSKFSAREPTCSFEETCSRVWIMLIVVWATAIWNFKEKQSLKTVTNFLSFKFVFNLLTFFISSSFRVEILVLPVLVRGLSPNQSKTEEYTSKQV